MSKPMNIYLIRHGESEGNVNEEIYKEIPDWSLNLTEKGKEQAKSAAASIHEDIKEAFKHGGNNSRLAVYCSPWARARQTALPLLAYYPEALYREDPRIREQEWGNFMEEELRQKIEQDRYRFGTFHYRMPYGESGADVYDRVSGFMDTLFRDFEKDGFPNNVAIFSHGLTIRVFLMRWLHWTPEQYEELRNPKNGAVIKMEKEYPSGGFFTRPKYKLVTKLEKRSK